MFSKRTAVLVLALLVAVAASSSAKRRPRSTARPKAPTVVIWSITALGVEEDTYRKVMYDLRQAFDRTPGYRLLPDKQIARRLQRARLGKESPLDKVVPALKAKHVLTGTMGGLGDEVSLDLKILDGTSGAELRRVAVSLPMEIQERRSVLDEVLVQLLAPGDWVGTLVLDCPVEGAQVFLDEKLVATTPLPRPLTGLTPGKHILRITKQGYGEFNRFVVVRYNSVARLQPDLKNNMVVGLIYERKKPEPPKPKPAPPPPEIRKAPPRGQSTFQKVMAWTFLGVGAGLVGTGIYFATAKDNTTWSTVFITAGGVSLAGSLVLFLVGLGGDDTPAPGGGEAPAGLILGPAAVPGGAILTLGGRF